MLPSTYPREALLACSPFPPWNLPSFILEFTLSSSCSCSNLPLTRQGVALAHLDSLPPHDLVLRTESSVPFPFGKGNSGVLANCSLCGTEATLSFSADPVCSSISAEACVILQALCWYCSTNKSAISILFFYLTLTLSSPPPFILPQSLWQELSSLSSCSIRLQWGPWTLVSPGEQCS